MNEINPTLLQSSGLCLDRLEREAKLLLSNAQGLVIASSDGMVTTEYHPYRALPLIAVVVDGLFLNVSFPVVVAEVGMYKTVPYTAIHQRDEAYQQRLLLHHRLRVGLERVTDSLSTSLLQSLVRLIQSITDERVKKWKHQHYVPNKKRAKQVKSNQRYLRTGRKFTEKRRHACPIHRGIVFQVSLEDESLLKWLFSLALESPETKRRLSGLAKKIDLILNQYRQVKIGGKVRVRKSFLPEGKNLKLKGVAQVIQLISKTGWTTYLKHALPDYLPEGKRNLFYELICELVGRGLKEYSHHQGDVFDKRVECLPHLRSLRRRHGFAVEMYPSGVFAVNLAKSESDLPF